MLSGAFMLVLLRFRRVGCCGQGRRRRAKELRVAAAADLQTVLPALADGV